jgi:hypothetical protein
VVEKAAKPWVRGRGSGGLRRSGVGGIKPMAFGQFGEMGPGLEAPLASI